MIRIGIIGLGWWGKQIVTCLAESARFTVVAGCDVDHNMAASFAREHGFDLVTDYKDLVARRDLDAIAVVTPHLLHEEMAIAALAAGKQVFCEKPLALNTASVERILAASAKRGGVLGVGHERRYEPATGGDAAPARGRLTWPRPPHGRQCQPQQFPQHGPVELAARSASRARRRLDRARHPHWRPDGIACRRTLACRRAHGIADISRPVRGFRQRRRRFRGRRARPHHLPVDASLLCALYPDRRSGLGRGAGRRQCRQGAAIDVRPLQTGRHARDP